MPRVSEAGEEAGVLHVPGVYAALLERERQLTDNGDPRRIASGRGHIARPTRLFRALLAGEPVELPKWKLGGQTVPDRRIKRLCREDRTITGWVVKPDDSVIPVRDEGRS